jgi:hypothetical protein
MVLPLLFSFLGSGLANAGVLGAAGSFLANPLVAGAIGSGLGTAVETGDIKKGIGAGLGSFAGGSLAGGLAGGLGGAGAAGAASTANVSGNMAESLRPVARPNNLMGSTAIGDAGAGFQDIARAGMDFGSSAQGIGSMVGSSVGSALAGGGGNKSSGGSGGPDLSQMRPMAREARTPGAGFVPGQSPEFDFGVSAPYTTQYMDKYAPQGMAGGGMVERVVPGYGPVPMREGGIADIGAAPQARPPGAQNEREVISAAIAAVQGTHPQPQVALGAFLAQYGEAALRDLVDRVKSGEMGETAAKTEGKLAGPGDGMADMIPATIDGQDDVLLSDGEYIVPADVVSGLGNGSSDAGAQALDTMNDRVRIKRTGKSKQAPEVPQNKMMPA